MGTEGVQDRSRPKSEMTPVMIEKVRLARPTEANLGLARVVLGRIIKNPTEEDIVVAAKIISVDLKRILGASGPLWIGIETYILQGKNPDALFSPETEIDQRKEWAIHEIATVLNS